MATATKTAEIKKTVKKISAPCQDDKRRAQVKLRIHVICILVAGTVSFCLYANHIGTPVLNSFGPVFPSFVQELCDRIKHT
jgi:hypothetical protein